MSRTKAIIAAVAIAAGCHTQAVAQTNCAKRDQVVQRLSEKYQETSQGYGVSKGRNGKEQVFELFASPETGTFTVLLSDDNGIACIVAVGTDFTLSPSAYEKKERT